MIWDKAVNTSLFAVSTDTFEEPATANKTYFHFREREKQ